MFTIKSYKSIPEREEEVTNFWKKNKTFEKSISSRPKTKKKVFVDGPPFVTGSPHYGSLLSSIAKDVIPRFWTMKGFRVRRVWGWDCHGLPIEEKVNQQLKVKNREQLENEIGVNEYIEACRTYVNNCISEWGWYVDKVGRWVDLENAYYTMNPEFNESVIWAFKEIYKKGLIYKGKRVSLFSTDTSTPVSQFEVAMDTSNYREVEDLSVFVKFEVKEHPFTKETKDQPVNLVAWTTTPWTIPSNFAIAVNEKFTYVLVKHEGEYIVVSKDRLDYTFEGNPPKILDEFKGIKLEGLTYTPVYDYFVKESSDNDFKVYLSEHVTDEDGTGILHIAPGFGEVDFNLGLEHGISDYADINESGEMTVGPWKGTYLRDACEAITKDLDKKGSLLRSKTYTHRVPFYRGENPLIYMAQDAYFIDIQKIKARMVELNKDVNWVPSHFKQGRVAKTYETSPDWCISRNRYWATIMPIWKSDDDDELVIGSFDEMMDYCAEIEKKEDGYYRNGKKLTLHRDSCDDIVLTKDGKKYYRVEEVLDVWLDSGSVPFAEYHYPFENKKEFEDAFPADFITEYVGQIRAWFNVLMRVSTILFDKAPFQNSVTTGNLAGTDGRKMSKSFGNYPDPRETLETIGGDALRLYLMGSPLMVGEDIDFNEDELSAQVKTIIFPVWNSVKYFVTYANQHSYEPKDLKRPASDHPMDVWIMTRTEELVGETEKNLDEYNMPKAIQPISPFVDDLSTWFIRGSRDRFVRGDKSAIATLYFVLVRLAYVLAPTAPFLAESMYRVLVKGIQTDVEDSVHLETWIPGDTNYFDKNKKVLEEMSLIRSVASLGQAARVQSKMKLRQPLASVAVSGTKLNDWMKEMITRELNVKSVNEVDSIRAKGDHVQKRNNVVVELDLNITDELKQEGLMREFVRKVQDYRKKTGLQFGEEIMLKIASDSKELNEMLKAYDDEIKEAISAGEIITNQASNNGKAIKVNDIELQLAHTLSK